MKRLRQFPSDAFIFANESNYKLVGKVKVQRPRRAESAN